MDVMMRLKNVENLKKGFDECRSKGTGRRGPDLISFTRLVLAEIQHDDSEAQALSQSLVELFDQIDINGDGE